MPKSPIRENFESGNLGLLQNSDFVNCPLSNISPIQDTDTDTDTRLSCLSSMIIGLIRAHALLSRNIGKSGEKLLLLINKSKLISWRQRPDHESLIMTLFKLFFNNFEDSSPEQLSSIYNLHPQSYLKDRLTIKSNFQTWSLSQRFWLK